MHDLGRKKLKKLFVDSDITSAETLPSFFYTDDEYFEASKQKIFSRSWQFACDSSFVRVAGQVAPFMLLEDFLDEPVIFTRDHNDRVNCLSNVCTHRGNLLVDGNCIAHGLRCRYHGRKFSLDGKFVSMPEFEGVKNFPSAKDDLPGIPFDSWGPFMFASIRPVAPLHSFMDDMFRRMSWFGLGNLKADSSRSKDYLVRCHWALYCENYLEGFHIPYVHNSLNDELDYGSYTTELFPFSVLQTGFGKNSAGTFRDLPAGSGDKGSVSAFYYWIFPNLMFNFYPWGISVNVVTPLRNDLTRVSFISYVLDESLLGEGAGAELDKVEREDEAIVENVQKGIASGSYISGRYSPKRETGTHHFHRLICDFMND